jgi:hypothetical protein
MTDDRATWRYYAGAALTGLISHHAWNWDADSVATKVSDIATTIANAMLAAEKERFPEQPPRKSLDEHLIEYLEKLDKQQHIHPLAGTANDGE